ncbi:MAG: phospholipase D-like domain-containing protein [Pseudomonadales bacterium]
MQILALSSATLAGCATLPRSGSEAPATQSDRVDFEGPQGLVSQATSNAILDSLDSDQTNSTLLAKHQAYEQSVNSGSPLVLGNRLTLLQNGPATYAAMFEAIRGATDSINVETYIFEGGVVGQQFSDLLLERQSAGVQVNVIHDSIGSLMTPEGFFDRLRDGGVEVLEFNPVNPFSGRKGDWLINNRDHRRQLIVDGRIAFTGGVNISDTYGSAPRHRRRRRSGPAEDDVSSGWRDTHIQIEGPVVAEFQRLFLETWARQEGVQLAVRDYFPQLPDQGDGIVRAVGSTPDDPRSLIYLTLMSAIRNAERSVHLTIAYFAPDPQLMEALTEAASRGVDVVLVLPSYSDSWPIFHLGHVYYAQLLKGGVKIYERRGAVMHAKTACIDGIWSTIGSTNLDWRSFLHNDEINAVVLGRDFARQMETMFAEDIEQSQAMELEAWKRRPWSARIKEQIARLGAYWL